MSEFPRGLALSHFEGGPVKKTPCIWINSFKTGKEHSFVRISESNLFLANDIKNNVTQKHNLYLKIALYFARRHYFLKRLVLFQVPGKIMHLEILLMTVLFVLCK